MLVWFYLLLAGVFEIVWAVALKYSNGFTNFKASAIVIIGMIISFHFLSLSMKGLPISLAYPIWTAIGAIGTAVFGMIVLGDSVSVLKIICLLLVVVGVVGLKIFS
ncbi:MULTISPECIES: DMT family transporter [unclassified Francisella]|uniref:DMT family transporter n=1 Tax=unclassified Francisella TaxID=2610885 RepID=UPI002E351F4F|nr:MULTISPECIES: multidrug efflux SMR transporter [unclassified Francisella]MED7819595.1 multidrug efflux SMR transporter [Francisella sp. 19S2-4]MED7830387.1 multidrug efflux SMR transporter [Francisella sp. 19S2-10]